MNKLKDSIAISLSVTEAERVVRILQYMENRFPDRELGIQSANLLEVIQHRIIGATTANRMKGKS